MIIPLRLIFLLKVKTRALRGGEISGEQLLFSWLPCGAWSFSLAGQQLSIPKLLRPTRWNQGRHLGNTQARLYFSVTCGSPLSVSKNLLLHICFKITF